MSAAEEVKSEKPKSLNKPIRKRVKKFGKMTTRKIAKIQSRSSLVPDTPFIDNSHFPFLEEFEDKWEVIRDEVKEVLKHRNDIPGFE